MRRLSLAAPLLFLAVPACEPTRRVEITDPPLPDGPPIIGPSDTPASLLDKAIAALGGEKRLTRWRCGRVKYDTRSETITGLDRPSTVEEFFELPGRFKRVSQIGVGERRRTVTFLVNGDEGYQYLPDGTAAPLPAVTLVAALRSEHAFADFYNLCRLREPRFRLSVRGSDTVGGRGAVVLHAEADFANPVDYAFDSATALLVKTTRHLLKPAGGERLIEIFLSDYRDLGGGVVPLHIKGRSEGKLLLDFTIRELELVDHLDDSVFAGP